MDLLCRRKVGLLMSCMLRSLPDTLDWVVLRIVIIDGRKYGLRPRMKRVLSPAFSGDG